MRVAILGCGYVGLALGRRLAESGHEVVGVRRSGAGIDEIEEAGLTAVRADVTDAAELAAVPDVDAVVFSASAGDRGGEAARRVYVDGLRTVVEQFGSRESAPGRLVYTSSTGVYGDHGGDWVDETTPLEPVNDKTTALVDAEEVAFDARVYGIDPTVVRFGGIYGPGRHRIDRYLEGPVTAGWLNLVHREDAAGIVAFLLETDRGRDEIVVAVDNEPVDRRELADWVADYCEIEPPPKQSVEERLAERDLSETAARRIRADKRCSNARLREMGYEFDYPTFREGYGGLIDERI